MGKKNKVQKSRGGDDVKSADTALDEQMKQAQLAKRKRVRLVDDFNEEEQDEQYVGAVTSSKILKTARKQKQEEENAQHNSDSDDSNTERKSKRVRESRLSLSDVPSRLLMGDDDDEGNEESEYGDYDCDAPVVQIDEHEAELLSQFMPNKNAVPAQLTLAQLIQQKIDEKETEVASVMSETGGSLHVRKLDPRVQQMYEGVRDVLATYRSGKIPKAFKIIPKLVNWEQVVAITEPDKWSAAAMYQATRIFVSNLSAKMCQRFINLVLLPRIRDDIAEYKRLNYHLYQALHKSLFKASAFYKGFLLPLCESGTCTHREAFIIASVLSKCSVPMLQTAAAMMRLAQMEYTGANSIFLRALIDKKYTLPCRVVDAIVEHFLNFTSDTREMPVLWHQCLLAFAARYKSDMSQEQRAALMHLIRVHNHHIISDEIRRELTHATEKSNKNGVDVIMTDV